MSNRFCVKCGARKNSTKGTLCLECARPVKTRSIRRGKHVYITIATEIKNNRARIMEVL